MIFSIYVNHRHPSPPPRRHFGGEEAVHLPTLFVPSERAKNSWEQAGCVPLPPRKAAKTRKALQTLAFLLLRRTLYPLGQQRNAPCALSGRRGRKAASTACRDAKICKFDFLKIHLLKSIYVNLIFDFCWQRSQKSRFFFAFPVKWAIAEEVTFHPFFRPFPRENEGKRTPRRLSAAHVRGRKCPPPESP